MPKYLFVGDDKLYHNDATQGDNYFVRRNKFVLIQASQAIFKTHLKMTRKDAIVSQLLLYNCEYLYQMVIVGESARFSENTISVFLLFLSVCGLNGFTYTSRSIRFGV